MSKPIYKLMMPFLWAAMILGLSGQAMGALTFTSVVDSLGRQWGNPFSVTQGTYSAQLTEITTAGYTAASIADVASMYLDMFGPNGLDPYWPAYAAAFGFGGADARTTTLYNNSTTFHRVTGWEQGQFKDLGTDFVPNTFIFGYSDLDLTRTLNKYNIGFMFYKQVPEPTLTLLLGGSLMGLGYVAYRRKKALG